jgi:hypothetical protein
MSKKSEAVKLWRKNTKARIIESMGGGCQICGYKKCDSALALHHIDPSQKDISLSSIRANPKNWISVVEELRKCVLLCHNCHSELHSGLINLPVNYKSFDETYVLYKKEKVLEQDECPVCKNIKPKLNKFCSLSCSSKSKFKVDWDNINLKELLKHNSIVNVAEKLNVSDMAVRKRIKKMEQKHQW